ncbi:MAG: hypothetical protein ACTSP1_19480 [Candidatus Freyarchaeota archaeon]
MLLLAPFHRRRASPAILDWNQTERERVGMRRRQLSGAIHLCGGAAPNPTRK